MKEKRIFKNFGPAFLILALGIGSGEFILWPYLSANYGFGILWGAILGITLQLFLINIISRNTIIFSKNILNSFLTVFPWIFPWIIFSTLIGFGWPGFSSLASKLLINGFEWSGKVFLPLSIFLLILAGSVLVFSKSAYKKILFLEKIAMSALFLLTIFLFIWYFQWDLFLEMFAGFLGIGNGYNFIPTEYLNGGFLTLFLAAVAYAGSGGNLLLANSFYVQEDKKGGVEKDDKKILENIFKQNILFFWAGGVLIISMLSYVSYAVLAGVSDIHDDFSFLILEARIFSNDIFPFVGYLFIFLGAFALFGVQLGIFDFLGRIAKHLKKSSNKFFEKISDRAMYNASVMVMVFFGLAVLLSGFEKPKTLIAVGAVINAFSMGAIAFLLFLLEIKKVPKNLKSKKIIFGTIFATIFYISFFFYVVFSNIF